MTSAIDDDSTLALGLGFSSDPKTEPRRLMINGAMVAPPAGPAEPNLTLALSGDHSYTTGLVLPKIRAITEVRNYKAAPGFDDYSVGPAESYGQQASPPHSTVSSFSSPRAVKRERPDTSGDEVEVELERARSSSKGPMNNNNNNNEEDGEVGVNGRKKLRLTKDQSALLEESFKQHSTLNPKQKQALARQLNLRPRQVEVWFQNRRARTKLKQTEVDCEFLKKCCETLTDENRRLQKELQELKAQPFYMRLPAATLTMCPSCERVGAAGGGGGDRGSKSPFSMAPNKSHLIYNPFNNPSAAC